MVTTDYRKEANRDSLRGESLGRYRFAHWLCDTLKNFFSDPSNVRDERLARLLFRQDVPGTDRLDALFKVDLPYSKDVRKACTTPAIMVSAGNTSYPAPLLNCGVGAVQGAIGATPMYRRRVVRAVDGQVAVLTESLDGTLLLAGEIEDFLVQHALLFPREGMVSQFNVTGSSAPSHIGISEAGNAKDLYQTTIGVSAVGNLDWTVDTQGPVFRGMERVTTVQ